MHLLDACRAVMNDPEVLARYDRQGLNSFEILTEIRRKFGDDAFPLVSPIDVADEMRSFYGRPR